MKVYLDNCCYNRPYDDQSQMRVFLEARAKIAIQDMIKNRELELVSSYVMKFENDRNPHVTRRKTIQTFMNGNMSIYIDTDRANEVITLGNEIISAGIKHKDAYHVACAILGNADFFLTTDDRLLKYHSDQIRLMNPTHFLQVWREQT